MWRCGTHRNIDCALFSVACNSLEEGHPLANIPLPAAVLPQFAQKQTREKPNPPSKGWDKPASGGFAFFRNALEVEHIVIYCTRIDCMNYTMNRTSKIKYDPFCVCAFIELLESCAMLITQYLIMFRPHLNRKRGFHWTSCSFKDVFCQDVHTHTHTSGFLSSCCCGVVHAVRNFLRGFFVMLLTGYDSWFLPMDGET